MARNPVWKETKTAIYFSAALRPDDSLIMLNPQFHTILYRALLIILLGCYKLFISYSYFQKNKNVALSWPRTRGQQIVGGRLNRVRYGILIIIVICILYNIISTGISRNALCSRVPEKLAGYKICAGYFFSKYGKKLALDS